MIKRLFQKYFTAGFFLNAPLVINTAIALVTLPIALANLPLVGYGKFQFTLAVQIWLLAFSGPNINAASKRGIAKGLNGTFLYAFLARSKLLIPAGILVLTTAFFLKISGTEGFPTLFAISGLYLILGYSFHISFYEFLIAKKKFGRWCYWQILISSVSLIGSAATAYFTKSIVCFALFQLGSVSALGLVAWLWIIKKEALIESYKNGEIDKECVPYGLKLIPADLVSVTAGRISDFIIGPFFGFASLAIFSVANKLRDKFAGIIKSVRPLLYSDFAKIERKELTKIINRHLAKVGTLGIVLTLGFIGVGGSYIKIFLPEPFHQAIIYFAILILGLPAAILSIVLHTLLESHLRYKELTLIGIIPNLLRIVLILVFGYFWRIIGVCISVAISNWISFGFYYFLALRSGLVMKFLNNRLGWKVTTGEQW
jgi:O-antigen/teichoic acid export membrane protein